MGEQSRGRAAMADKQMEQVIATLLRAGVLLSAAFVIYGGLLYLHRHHGAALGESGGMDYRVFHSADQPFRNLRNILHSASLGNSAAIIQCGILLLIATPVARVVFSVFAFLMERDWMYVLFSLCVLGILVYSLTRGAVF